MQKSEVSKQLRWHPKLTPYRLLVLGTTIGVGTAKAVVAQRGESNTSTTLEWVLGVVIFLILHTLSAYDELPRDPPLFLGWLFRVDCMDYFWPFLSLSRIPRPAYASEPKPTTHLFTREHVLNAAPATLYRLLVCFATMCFGLTKATMTYFGYSSGANWVDWTLGAVVTSVLFILGMYESNSVGMWHVFFVSDRKEIAFTTMIVVGIFLGCAVYLLVGINGIISSAWEVYTFFRSNVDPSSFHLVSTAVTILIHLGVVGAMVFMMWFIVRNMFLPPLWAYWDGDVHWHRHFQLPI